MHPAVSNGSYDVNRIREDFPILGMQVYGKPLVYLDNGASAQKPKAVLERMNQAYTSEYSNVHRGLHYLANAATDGYEGARERVAAFLNAERTDEIIFTRGATEAVNLVAQTYGRANIGPGDEIVLSIMEHHANIVPWHFLRERQGAVIKWAPVDDEGNFLLDEFEKLLSDRTKIVAITQMSNVLGTVVPVKDVVRIAHARGIPVLVDGAQASVHMEVDVRDIDCDFYVITGHKLYGPTGIGALYGKHAILSQMPPFNGGGEMIREVSRDTVTYGAPPHRFEAGTPAIVQAIGLGAALDYIRSIGKDRIHAHEASLVAYAHEKLSEINSLRIIGNAPGKGAIVSFAMENAHAHDVATVIDRAGIAVRAGTHCAMPLLERFGVSATCRASFALY
ncbi:MAG TPA: cysteine desulfurase, partial [Xanthobacteraceae bacterium]|nr:cysteine desulfurase [Xanthobacteraceae bacterium]HQS49336.1 cysteine desulfurase [Xanthobacteraceae bacterium]